MPGLTATELSALSRLLDQALDLEPAEREAWLQALPEADRTLAPLLREMLEEHARTQGCGLLGDMPRLADLPEPGAGDICAGHRIGPYRLLREIGHGGMGTVWLAERADGAFKRQVALKLPRLAWGEGLAQRMAREREIGALLEHPHIARLYDAGLDEQGRPYLALEYIEGRPIDAWCREHALPLHARLRLVVQVAQAVAYAHGRLVVHRDLKPSNVLVSADGQVHLLDFGIAKLLNDAAIGETALTQQQGRVLTPQYASPEQIRGEPITVASDVYSLGVLAFELLTGRSPYEPKRQSLGALEEAVLETGPATASARAQDPALARALRGDVDTILAKALQREPANRYASAEAMAADIERYLSGEPVQARPGGRWYRWGKLLRRHRTGFAAAAVALSAVLIGATLALLQAQRANQEAERARLVKDFVVDIFKVNARDDPAKNELRQLPAELLLERGARLIDSRFAGQPRLQAELLGVVGTIFQDMGAREQARDYAQREQQALIRIGAGPADIVPALILQARAELAMGQLDTAIDLATQALDRAGHYGALAWEPRLLLARALLVKGRLDQAATVIAALRTDLSRQGGVAAADLDALQADWLAASNRFDEAMPVYQRAIEEALAAEGANSYRAIETRVTYGRELVKADRADQARGVVQAALAAMRALGGEDDLRAMLFEVDYAQRMLNLANLPFAEARQVIERHRNRLARDAGRVPPNIRAWVEKQWGSVHLDWGDLAEAYPALQRAYAVLGPLPGDPRRRSRLITDLAEAMQDTGRHVEADALNREALALDLTFLPPGSPWLVWSYFNPIMNLDMQDRHDDALALLGQVPPAEPMRGRRQAPASFTDAVALIRALILLDKGDAAGGLAALPPIEGPIDDFPMIDRRLPRGRALCEMGRPAEGLPLMETWTRRLAETHFEADVRVARWRALTGRCALAAGQPDRARELAALAATALARQPQVSRHYQAPLQVLQARLAQR